MTILPGCSKATGLYCMRASSIELTQAQFLTSVQRVRGPGKTGPTTATVVRCGMATKRSNPRKDFTQTALDVVRQATGEAAAPAPSTKPNGGRKRRLAETGGQPATKNKS